MWLGLGPGGEHLHGVGPYLDDVAFVAIAVVVAACVELAFDVELVALVDVFLDCLGELTPEDDVVPLGLLGDLGAVLEGVTTLGGGKAEAGDGDALVDVADFGLGAYVADEHYFVHVCVCCVVLVL